MPRRVDQALSHTCATGAVVARKPRAAASCLRGRLDRLRDVRARAPRAAQRNPARQTAQNESNRLGRAIAARCARAPVCAPVVTSTPASRRPSTLELAKLHRLEPSWPRRAESRIVVTAAASSYSSTSIWETTVLRMVSSA